MSERLTDVVGDVGAEANRGARPLAESGRQVTGRRRKGPALPWARTMRRLVRTLGLLVPVVLVAGALTGCDLTPGGTASLTFGDFGAAGLQFDAVSGRNNSITVSLGSLGSFGYPSSLLLRDARNVVAAGPGCARVDLNTVRCETPPSSVGIVAQEIRLGDGDDTFASSVAGPFATAARIDAGAGNDTVNGGPSDGYITAGAGDDTVNGGAGNDVLIEGSDALDRDSFSGGDGHDLIYYEGVLHAVNISLNDVADDGRPGEGDNVKSDIEDISGTGNADTLIGDGDANTIFPRAFNDEAATYGWTPEMTGGVTIDGGGGADRITGTNWGNPDQLSGGIGNDTIRGFAGNDVLRGEAGNDSLSGGEGFDALDGGTETDYCDVGPDGGTTVNCETGP